MSTWTIIGRKPATGSNTRVDITFFKNGFNVNGFDMEVYDDVRNGHTNFKESIKRGEIPKEVLESKHYHASNIDYYFQEKEELGESLAWRNYQSSRVQLQDYNSDWPKLYQKERESIHNALRTFYSHNIQPEKLFDVEHIGSTSVEGMCAKPMIDLLIIAAHYARGLHGHGWNVINVLIQMGYQMRCPQKLACNIEDWLHVDGVLIKEKFIIHMVYVDNLSDTSASDFIAFRDYLRTHPQDHSDYSAQKIKISSNPLAIKDYAQYKNKIVNDLMDKATVWYRANQNFIHIGTFSMDTNQWSCCCAKENEASKDDRRNQFCYVGCYNPALKLTIYHPGRFQYDGYRMDNGAWTCCSDGWYSNGCKKVGIPLFFSTGRCILGDCDRWDVEGVGRWLQSLKHINKDYTTSFLTHGIDGYLLINSVDDEVLRDVGVSTVLHRRVILKAIDELKQKSSS
ncbi:unnamed protein product [Rotaria socialis]|uniref:SAM domain-containing protein n=1 Tax=Rotaria socialis TaxID=392032 RepID=A0A817TDS8_9BILA|nr:unnamed protein product [Rotaria socialis]CAF4525838.1 unnamed protein product [Rotaria socialis]